MLGAPWTFPLLYQVIQPLFLKADRCPLQLEPRT